MELPLRFKERLERLTSLINAVERKFTPDFPMELLLRSKERLERFMSSINDVER